MDSMLLEKAKLECSVFREGWVEQSYLEKAIFAGSVLQDDSLGYLDLEKDALGYSVHAEGC